MTVRGRVVLGAAVLLVLASQGMAQTHRGPSGGRYGGDAGLGRYRQSPSDVPGGRYGDIRGGRYGSPFEAPRGFDPDLLPPGLIDVGGRGAAQFGGLEHLLGAGRGETGKAPRPQAAAGEKPAPRAPLPRALEEYLRSGSLTQEQAHQLAQRLGRGGDLNALLPSAAPTAPAPASPAESSDANPDIEQWWRQSFASDLAGGPLDAARLRRWFTRCAGADDAIDFADFRRARAGGLTLFQSMDENGTGQIEYLEFARPMILVTELEGEIVDEDLRAGLLRSSEVDGAPSGPSGDVDSSPAAPPSPGQGSAASPERSATEWARLRFPLPPERTGDWNSDD